ncbi:hypothetical protein C2E20_9101 [Micractinium conductrix]|uniref:Uncharacterized protein n=1 Tax=Micractinium conductrix TaxID=554055 RepID=A0A2P6UZD0_9CHLO|nr:hypothetical protein C2E20_9101 [Micractinium conductrix]|eukprot:PSC67202.1 hypothetical protein C2E20_9101 [Micractinium conductrix]
MSSAAVRPFASALLAALTLLSLQQRGAAQSAPALRPGYSQGVRLRAWQHASAPSISSFGSAVPAYNTGPGTLRINTIISNVSCALPDDCLVVPSTGEVLADNVTMEIVGELWIDAAAPWDFRMRGNDASAPYH